MSTDYQRYSIENQAVIIAAYAQAHSLTIVRICADKGESGLKLRNRDGLIQLLDDVQSGRAEFNHILVLDGPRFSRCGEAGVEIPACDEQKAIVRHAGCCI
jgi:DNA invertase Pin-like site-specific DNA recombinase